MGRFCFRPPEKNQRAGDFSDGLLAESSSFLARVLTRRDKPKPRGDDSDSQSDDGIAEPKDGLCPTALRADFGDNGQDRGCDSRSDRVTYRISPGTLYPLLRGL